MLTIEEKFGKEENMELIAEPGKFFAGGTTTLFCNVIGRRLDDESRHERMIYINDGVYGNLMNALIESPISTPYLVKTRVTDADKKRVEEGGGDESWLRSLIPIERAFFDYVIWGALAILRIV